MLLALAAEDINLWQITLIAGAVVIVAVIALLSLLLVFVRSIETGVQQLWDVAKGVASNTGNIKIALAVADSLDEVAEEARRHARLLGVGAG
jgi:ABC-type sulfate transport system permease subunit